MKKTIVVLGAGSSLDYGFPLWSELLDWILSLDKPKMDSIGFPPNFIDNFLFASEKIRELSVQHNDWTLDKLVYEIDKPKEVMTHSLGFYVMAVVSKLLAIGESEARGQDEKWISKLQDKIVKFVARNSFRNSSSDNLLDSLEIISLNYERTFEHFMRTNFYDKLRLDPDYDPPDLSSSRILAFNTRLKIYYPHGRLGLLSVGDSRENEYSVPKDLSCPPMAQVGLMQSVTNVSYAYGQHPSGQDAKIAVVDALDARSYGSANQALRDAESVFCLGLSSAGIIQSGLTFDRSSKVFLSNSASDTAEIRRKKPGPQYIRLSENSSRLDADDFPEKFAEIALNI